MNHFMGKGCRRQLKWPDQYLPSIFYFETEATSLCILGHSHSTVPDPSILALREQE
jgi:hypothetical protein